MTNTTKSEKKKKQESSLNLKLKIETGKPIIHNPSAGNSKN
jgi:hypothetical protein